VVALSGRLALSGTLGHLGRCLCDDRGVSRAALIRPRRDDDVAVLADLLIEQQPGSRYPDRWPLPFPVEDFLVRDREQAAWVAELDGTVVGHVMVASVESELSATVFRGRTGCTEPAVVSAMFVGDGVRGRGLGGVLLETAVPGCGNGGGCRSSTWSPCPTPHWVSTTTAGGSRSAAAGSTGYPPMSLTSCRWPCHRSGPATETPTSVAYEEGDHGGTAQGGVPTAPSRSTSIPGRCPSEGEDVEPGLVPAGDVVEAMHSPACGGEGVAQGGLPPVREVAGKTKLDGGPGVSVALLDGEAQDAVVAGRASGAGAGEHVPEIGAVEVEQYGVGDDPVPGPPEVTGPHVEEPCVVPGRPQPREERGGGVAAGHPQPERLQVQGVLMRTFGLGAGFL